MTSHPHHLLAALAVEDAVGTAVSATTYHAIKERLRFRLESAKTSPSLDSGPSNSATFVLNRCDRGKWTRLIFSPLCLIWLLAMYYFFLFL